MHDHDDTHDTDPHDDSTSALLKLDDAAVAMIKDIVDRQQALDDAKAEFDARIHAEKTQIKDDIKALSQRLNVAKRQIQDTIKLVQQARRNEEVLELHRNITASAQTVLDA